MTSAPMQSRIVPLLHDRKVALLSIDLQYLDAAPGFGLFSEIDPRNIPESYVYYFEQLRCTVLPHVRRLQGCFRKAGFEVMHARICSLTRDGRDRSAGHKRLGLHAVPGSKDAEILAEVAPMEDEIVFDKTTSGVFTGTNLAVVLRNLDIRTLVVAGVYTNECVSTTVRDACDLGFDAIVVEDACTTLSKVLHEGAISVLRDRYALVIRTDELIEGVRKVKPVAL